MKVINYQDVQNKILLICSIPVILDSDVAEMYQVGTKTINQAVSRNIEKFPEGYILSLSHSEKSEVVTNCDHLKGLRFSKNLPKAFTERALYMLATILKSPVATQTTLLIIDTFAKTRELSRIINQSQVVPDNSIEQKTLMQKASDLITHLVVSPDNLQVIDTETIIEMNLAILKIKRTVKKSK